MRKTLKGRLKKCQELAGQMRIPGDPNTRLNQVATASLLSDIATKPEPGLKAQKGQPDSMVAFAIGHLYPPCTALLQDLQPMKMSDLCMETHHRGRVLSVRRMAPVVKLVSCSWTVVQEESSGEMERLEVVLHKSKHGEDILESGSMFKVKEPYFTLNDLGDPTLRINHPSDLIVCADNHEKDSPYSFAQGIGTPRDDGSVSAPPGLVTKTAKEYKEEGNDALRQQSLIRARLNYTHGIQLVKIDSAAEEELAYDLFRNRAYANLRLNCLDEAKADALASVIGLEDQKHKDLDSKAYYRAACAAYNLSEFQEAKRFFEEQQKLTTDDKGVRANLRKVELRLQEQSTGVYDFKKIMAGLMTGRPRVDAASFTNNCKVKESPGRGRGLFATRNIDSGEVIMCEKSFCVVWGNEDEALTAMTYDGRDDRIRVFPAGLCKAIVQKLSNNPSQIDKVMDLYGDYKGFEKMIITTDFGPVIDTFQIYDIVARNAFGPGPVYSGGRTLDEDASRASTGLWINASYINHSCIPNSKKEFMGDLMVLRATQPIGVGEEITHSYDESSDYDARTAALMNTWGFTCACALCIVEKAEPPALRKKRRDLESEAIAFLERNDPLRAKRLSIVKAQRLVQSISHTYEDERYNSLPHKALLRLQKWLAEATTW